MTIPLDQKAMVLKYESWSDFAAAFEQKYRGTINPVKLMSRAKNIWFRRAIHKKEVEEARAIERAIEAETARKKAEVDRTVMVPKVIHNKAPPQQTNKIDNGLPDIGELILRQNNLLAELIQLQKESNQVAVGILASQKEQFELFKSALSKEK